MMSPLPDPLLLFPAMQYNNTTTERTMEPPSTATTTTIFSSPPTLQSLSAISEQHHHQQHKQLILLIESLVDQNRTNGDASFHAQEPGQLTELSVENTIALNNNTTIANSNDEDGYVLMNIQTAPHISIRVLCADHVCPGEVVSAGILCFAIPPTGEDIFFLLSKDNANRGHCWSHLGGGRYNNETIEETAAREFIEESLNVVDIEYTTTNTHNNNTTNSTASSLPTAASAEIMQRGILESKQSRLVQMLLQGDYFVKIITCVNYGAPHTSAPTSASSPTTTTCQKNFGTTKSVVEKEQDGRTVIDGTTTDDTVIPRILPREATASNTGFTSFDNNITTTTFCPNYSNTSQNCQHNHRRRHHVTFVKQVPWQPHITVKYERIRKILVEISQRNDNINRYRQIWQTLVSKQPQHSQLQLYELGDTIILPVDQCDSKASIPNNDHVINIDTGHQSATTDGDNYYYSTSTDNITAIAAEFSKVPTTTHKTMCCTRLVIRTQTSDVIARLSSFSLSTEQQVSALENSNNISAIIMNNDQRPRTLLSCPYAQQHESCPAGNNCTTTTHALASSSFVYTDVPVLFEWIFQQQPEIYQEGSDAALAQQSAPIIQTQLVSPDDALLHAYIAYLREVYSLWTYWCQLSPDDRVHPALRVDYVRRTITIANEYDEKDELRLWSRCRLETVLQQGGSFQQQQQVPPVPHHNSTTFKNTIPRNTRTQHNTFNYTAPSDKSTDHAQKTIPTQQQHHHYHRRNVPQKFNTREVFRPSFLPTLAVALNCIAQSTPTIAHAPLCIPINTTIQPC